MVAPTVRQGPSGGAARRSRGPDAGRLGHCPSRRCVNMRSMRGGDSYEVIEYVISLAWVCLLALAPGWSLWQLVRGVHRGSWCTPGWFGRATWTSLYLAVGTWLWGLFSQSGIADAEDVCRYHGQPYDAVYVDTHGEAAMRLFPLSEPCNASYDLVPMWVNPTFVVFTVVFASSLGGMVVTLLQRRQARRDSSLT